MTSSAYSSETDRTVRRPEVSPEARKKAHGGRVVEIGANRQSCDPATILLFKLVVGVVLGVVGCLHGKDDVHRKRPIPLKSAD